VALSLYLHLLTEEKRAKHRLHLLARFSHVSCFLGHILCLLVWMVCSFVGSFISILFISINLRTKLVIINLRSKIINCIIKDFSTLL
jgi:hypothetical protein